MRVLMPLPHRDFDPTESAVPWNTLRERNVDVVFATPDAAPAAADPRMVTGEGLGPWKPILRANARATKLYAAMASSDAFNHPIAYDDIDAESFDGLVLAGGHAPGMKTYLESPVVQRVAAEFAEQSRPLGAICHGVIVLARARSSDGTPTLAGRRVTALTQSMELTAWRMTKLWLGDYYRTYPETVQDEVQRALGDRGQFIEGPFAVARDTPDRTSRGFTVQDGQLLTARWPGDAHRFANKFCTLLGS